MMGKRTEEAIGHFDCLQNVYDASYSHTYKQGRVLSEKVRKLQGHRDKLKARVEELESAQNLQGEFEDALRHFENPGGADGYRKHAKGKIYRMAMSLFQRVKELELVKPVLDSKTDEATEVFQSPGNTRRALDRGGSETVSAHGRVLSSKVIRMDRRIRELKRVVDVAEEMCSKIVSKCWEIKNAVGTGKLGRVEMPERRNLATRRSRFLGRAISKTPIEKIVSGMAKRAVERATEPPSVVVRFKPTQEGGPDHCAFSNARITKDTDGGITIYRPKPYAILKVYAKGEYKEVTLHE